MGKTELIVLKQDILTVSKELLDRYSKSTELKIELTISYLEIAAAEGVNRLNRC